MKKMLRVCSATYLKRDIFHEHFSESFFRTAIYQSTFEQLYANGPNVKNFIDYNDFIN